MSNTSQPAKAEPSALLLIEFQKTWTEDGTFHAFIKEQYDSRNVLGNTKAVADAARHIGMTVLQAPLIIDKEDPYRYQKAPMFAKQHHAFEKDTQGAEFADGIYAETDVVIHGRSSSDACIDSDLEERLNERRIRRIFVCGFATDHCVKDTMTSLINRGFECTMISDCTATTDIVSQVATERSFQTIASAQLIRMIEERGPGALT